MLKTNTDNVVAAIKRVRLWYVALFVIFGLFGVRLFYLQVIRHNHYKAAALSGQLKQYEVPARRGMIYAKEGDVTVPIVLNQKLYTLYADPGYIKDADKAAAQVAQAVGGQASDYLPLIKAEDTRYSVLKKRLTETQKNKIAKLQQPGLGTVEQDYRTYPQGTLAAQLLGFVNEDGQGKYGLEQALNEELTGVPGELKAVTDSRGVPLAANSDNIERAPVNGKGIVLTVDVAMQQQLEAILKKGVENAKSEGGSALIMDANTGAIKAMANYPTYDPSNFGSVQDGSVFNNAAVSEPLEVGSVMKPLTAAAALNQGVVSANTCYYDPAKYKVDEFTITNIEEDGPAGNRCIKDILNLSLNTGATWLLMQMGDGQLNSKGRTAWHSYMTEHYLFGQTTGIEQGYEATGYVPDAEDNGAGINLTYANTTFGQAMTATPLQLGAALAAVVNGGTYYQPHLVAAKIDASGKQIEQKPIIKKTDVVSAQVSQQIISMMQYTVDNHSFSKKFDQSRYSVGGKTGTAQIAKPNGGYYEDEFNGTYVGFVGGDKPQYVIVVKISKAKNGGYAGTAAAQPVFGNLAHMLLNNFNVTPRN
ncbi:MAG: putative Peptidoglycan glycosyltransferase [Candidatus Saccharibacteria bacterium]|nr:putative Peptidoglycan glycosyltransferase [Candidatus Saccharibacteria bacterium]